MAIVQADYERVLKEKKEDLEKLRSEHEVELASVRSQQEESISLMKEQHKQIVQQLQDQYQQEVSLPDTKLQIISILKLSVLQHGYSQSVVPFYSLSFCDSLIYNYTVQF